VTAAQTDPTLRVLERLLHKHRAWLFFDCAGAVLWRDGEIVGRIDQERAADQFELRLALGNAYGCDDKPALEAAS
jgi:hypothetical protein